MPLMPISAQPVAPVAAIALAISACGGSAPPADPPPSLGPRPGGQVVVAISSDLTTFNPYQWAPNAAEVEILDLLFPTLMIEQPDFALQPPSFGARLAASWEFSPDNRQLTFYLRPEARWSDGVPVTAEDVAFTYSVQKDPELGAIGYEFKDAIAAVNVLDRHTVRFTFTHVYPYQLMDANDGHIIPAHAWSAVPRQAWRETDFSKLLASCGPFRLASHTRGQTLILERDPGYWERPRPYLDRLIFRVIPEVASQVNQLLAGHVDLVRVVPPRDVDRLRAHEDMELIEFPSRDWGFLAWNNAVPPFDDRRVRRAMSLAINRKAAVDSVFFGHARLARGPILSSMWAFNRDLPVLPYDPDGARELLTEAGWRDSNGDGLLERGGRQLQFDILYPAANTLRRDLGQLISADLARVGVRARLVPVETATFLARQERGEFTAMLAAWTEATRIELSSTWATRGENQGSYNFISYSNPEVDRLIAAVRREADLGRAKVLLDRIQELIVFDQPVTFLYERNELVGISRRIRNANINAASLFFNVADWYWEP